MCNLKQLVKIKNVAHANSLLYYKSVQITVFPVDYIIGKNRVFRKWLYK